MDRRVLNVFDHLEVCGGRGIASVEQKKDSADLNENVCPTTAASDPSKVFDYTEPSLLRALHVADRAASVNLTRILYLRVAEYELWPEESAN